MDNNKKSLFEIATKTFSKYKVEPPECLNLEVIEEFDDWRLSSADIEKILKGEQYSGFISIKIKLLSRCRDSYGKDRQRLEEEIHNLIRAIYKLAYFKGVNHGRKEGIKPADPNNWNPEEVYNDAVYKGD